MKDLLQPVHKKDGQSLLEALVAMAVAILIVGGLVVAVIVAVRNAQFAKNQTLATKYANEGMEWIRSERDTDWTIFAARSGPPPGGTTYCLNNLSWASLPCSFSLANNTFKREAVLITREADRKIEAKVTVSWTDPAGPHKSELTSYFTKW